MNRVELLKEFEDMLNHNLFCYSADYLMNTPKKQYVKEWEETKEKIDILKDLIKQEEQEKDSVYYMVKDNEDLKIKLNERIQNMESGKVKMLTIDEVFSESDKE